MVQGLTGAFVDRFTMKEEEEKLGVRMNEKSLRCATFVESCILASEYGEIRNSE